jgi:hypothetical protein
MDVNELRSILAYTSLAAHSQTSTIGDYDIETDIIDLLADIMHLCSGTNVDFDKNLTKAKQHFMEEKQC